MSLGQTGTLCGILVYILSPRVTLAESPAAANAGLELAVFTVRTARGRHAWGKIGTENKSTSDFELEDEIDDQVVLASLTGMNTRKVIEEKQAESNSMNLEELDDLDVIRPDDKLNEVEVIDLKATDSLEGDGIELVVEPLLTDSSNHSSNVDEDLNTALKEQLQLSKESSNLISETEGFLEDVKSKTLGDEDRSTSNNDKSNSKGKDDLQNSRCR